VIDIHCHILPGLDDGPKTDEEALSMCEVAADDGVKTIVATPHTGREVYQTSAEDVLAGVSHLNGLLGKKGIPINILPGHDVYVHPEIIENIKKKKVLTVNDNGKYIILELPVQSVPFYVEKVVLDLKAIGVTGIISHPERNYHIQKNTGVLEKLVSSGALVQLTALSLTGGFGAPAQRTAVSLIHKGLAHIIASDGHSTEERPPVLSPAVKEAAKFIGEERALEMVNAKPREIIS